MKIECAHTNIVDVYSLVPNPKNPNKHPEKQLRLLAKIIEHQGQRSPITISKRSGFITKGHGRWQAIQMLGWEKCAIDEQHYANEADEYADMIADNKIAELADHDDAQMIEDIKNMDLPDLDLLGIPDFSITENDPAKDAIEDDVPETAPKRSKPGEVWLCGHHRVMCGDATNMDHVTTAIKTMVPDLIYTDPPYGMNAVSKSGVLKANYGTDIMGDNDAQTAKDAFNALMTRFPDAKHVWWGANYYASVLPDAEGWLVWDKDNGQSDQTDCELAWTNFRSVVRQFTQSSKKKNRVHPTQKPVALIEWIFRRFKYNGQNIFDPFGGSGSTLIAAEKHNRNAVIMEIDPKYVDVIIQRYEDYSGQTAKLDNAQ